MQQKAKHGTLGGCAMALSRLKAHQKYQALAVQPEETAHAIILLWAADAAASPGAAAATTTAATARARALVLQVGAAVPGRGRAGRAAAPGVAGGGGGRRAARTQATEAVAPLPELGHRRGPALQRPGVSAARTFSVGSLPKRSHRRHESLQRKRGYSSEKF